MPVATSPSAPDADRTVVAGLTHVRPSHRYGGSPFDRPRACYSEATGAQHQAPSQAHPPAGSPGTTRQLEAEG